MAPQQIEKVRNILIRLVSEQHISMHENHLLRTLMDENEKKSANVPMYVKPNCKNLIKVGKYTGQPHCTVFKSICLSRCK